MSHLISPAPARPVIALAALIFTLLVPLVPTMADPGEVARDAIEVATSPKAGWESLDLDDAGSYLPARKGFQKRDPWWITAALWIPNRVLDFIDIFRADVGVGGAYGGVLRVSEAGQVGYRIMDPGSVRIGDFGRRLPFVYEQTSEWGAGPDFKLSKERTVCTGELGLGVDLGVGIYLGICPEEALDFVAGIFTFDVMKDDLHAP